MGRSKNINRPFLLKIALKWLLRMVSREQENSVYRVKRGTLDFDESMGTKRNEKYLFFFNRNY